MFDGEENQSVWEQWSMLQIVIVTKYDILILYGMNMLLETEMIFLILFK